MFYIIIKIANILSVTGEKPELTNPIKEQKQKSGNTGTLSDN